MAPLGRQQQRGQGGAVADGDAEGDGQEELKNEVAGIRRSLQLHLLAMAAMQEQIEEMMKLVEMLVEDHSRSANAVGGVKTNPWKMVNTHGDS